MADNNETNIRLNMDVDGAISSIRRLQAEISNFHQIMSSSNRAAQKEADNLQKNLINSINKTRAFSASMQTVSSSADTFTDALERNKLTMRETFRHILGSSKMFGRQFSNEFDTITATARERVKDLQTQYIKLGKDANGAVQTIKIRPLLLDLDDLGTKTMMAAQKQQILNKLIAQGSTQLLNWGKNTQWAGRQLMVGFTVPLTMMGTVAAQTFMDIEKEIIKVQRVYGDFSTTTQETDKIVGSLKTVALEFTKWGVSVKDTMALAADAAATGKTGQELISQVTEATRLAVLGNVDQAKALETTMSVANAFGTSADQLAGKIDFLNAVENQSVTSIEDLTTAIPTAAPVIKQLGGNVEDLAFFLTAMREGGIDAAEGANALKSGLASMINPTKQATDFLGSFGINLKGIVEANKGDVKGMIVEFAKALDTLDPTNRARAIEQLFGKFQFARMSTLFQNVIKEGSQAQRVLDLTNASAQELAILSQRELSKVEESTTYKFQAAMEKFQAALAPVGEQFLKAVTPIIEFGTKLLEQFNSWGDGAKQFSVMFAAVVGGIGPVLLMAIGLIANGVANLIKFFQFLSGVFKGTGKQATVLGTETEYMTQAQLQAQAAASSLGQTHSKLPQIFTAERIALDLLTAAYERSIAVQRTFPAGQAAAAKTAGKKYAKGVVSVPGPKGAGDVVPAMLSPGEAVIPANMVQKYGPLISGMVSNSIPGFEKGTGSVSESAQIDTLKNNYKLRQAPEYVRKQTQAMVWDTLESEQKAYEDSVRAFYDKKGKKFQGTGNETLKSASHIRSDTRDVSLFGKIFAMKNWKPKNIVPDLQGINNFINNISQMTRKNGANPILDEFRDKKLPEFAKKMKMSMEDATTELENLRKGIHPVTEKSAKLLKEVADFTPGSDYVKQLEQSKSEDKRKSAFSIQRQAAGTSGALGARLKGSFYKMIGRGDLAYAADTEAKAAAQQEKSLAAANARGVAMGLGGGAVEPAKPVKKPRANAPKPNTSGQVFDPSKAAHARAVETRVGSDGKVRYYFNGKQISAANGQAAMEKVSQLDANNARARETRSVAKPTAKPSIGQRIAGGARSVGSAITSRAGMVGGMAMMGASMIPGVGEAAGALGMLGSAMMFLPPQAALVVGAIGLLGVAFMQMQQKIIQARKDGIAYADSLSMTGEKLQALSEATGTVSATELRRQQQADRVAGPQTEQQKAFGQSLLESDFGKSVTSDIQGMITKGLSSSEIGTNLGLQLSTAVAQGVLSQEQANSFGIAIGQSLNNYGISNGIELKLNEILGPNGERLSQEPLQVTLDIQKQSMAGIQSLISNLGSTNYNQSGSITDGYVTSYSSGFTAGNTELNSAYAELSMNQYSLNQSNLDTLNAIYDKKIETLNADLKSAQTDKDRQKILQQIKDTEESRKSDLQTQIDANNQITDQVKAQLAEISKVDPEAVNTALQTTIDKLYEGNAAYKTIATDALNKLKELNTMQPDFVATLRFQMASGELDPITAQALIKAGQENKQFGISYNMVVSTYGDAKSIELLQTLGANGADTTTQTMVVNMVANKTADMDTVLEAMSTFKQIQSNGGLKIDINSGSGQSKLNSIINNLKTLKDYGKKPFTYDILYKVTGNKDVAKALANSKEFNKLPKKQQISYVGTYTAVLQSQGDPVFVAAFKQWMTTHKGSNWADFAAWIAGEAVKSSVTTGGGGGGTTTGGDTTGGGGGGGSAKPKVSKDQKELDALNKKLDKQQKALNVISLLEQKVNERYDERKKALEKIAKLNAQISEAQKSQLDVADAIARGDIAGAARAMQDARSKAQDQADQKQQEVLEAARQAELDAITFAGKTRKELEDQIYQLQLQVAKKEYAMSGTDTSSSDTGGSGGGGGASSSSATDAAAAVDSIISDLAGIEVPLTDAVSKSKQAFIDSGLSISGYVSSIGDLGLAETERTKKAFEESGLAMSGFIDKVDQKVMDSWTANQKAREEGGTAEVRNQELERVTNYLSSQGVKVVNGIAQAVQASAVDGVTEVIQKTADTYQALMTGSANTALQSISSVHNTAVTDIGGLFKTTSASATTSANVIGAGVRASILTVSNTAQQQVPTLFNTITTRYQSTSNTLATTLSTNFTNVGNTAANTIQTKVIDKIGGITTPLTGLGTKLNDVAWGIGQVRVAAGLLGSNPIRRANGGLIKGSYFAGGGMTPLGTDIVPAMLTPGEFVVRRSAVTDFGVDRLNAINNGTYNDGSMYNYSVVVNAGSNASADEIANAVMTKIKGSENQRLRGSRI